MKKVIVVLVAFAVSTASTFALNPDKKEVFYKLNNQKVFNGLSKYLRTSEVQNDQLKSVFTLTEMKMKAASKSNDNNAYNNAVVYNLANAKFHLSEEQYRKYLTLLNLTLTEKMTVDNSCTAYNKK